MHKLHKFEDSVILGCGKALILPHLPASVSIDQVSNKIKEHPQSLLKLGLFDAASPNYTTYYPDVEAAEFVPKPDEIFSPLVRALSEVIVHKAYNPVDFSKPGVLKDSQQLLYGQSVMVDHEGSIGNILGVISDTGWQESYKSTEGITVPSGINAKLAIDGKSHTNLVRKMNMRPPAIHSFSVTVTFGWEPSHSQMPLEEFMRKIGTFDEKGNMYRRIANKVKTYREISLVAHGADPYAQLIVDGQITNPKYADVVYNSADGKPAGVKYHFLDFKDLISNSETTPEKTNETETEQTENSDTMNPILLLLAEKFGISVEGKDEATLSAEVQPHMGEFMLSTTTNADLVTSLTAEKEQLTTELTAEKAKVTQLEGKVANMPAMQKLGEAYQAELKADVLKWSTIANNNVPNTAIASLLETADVNTLIFLRDNNKRTAEEKYPVSCKKCGSKEVNRASTSQEENEGGENKPDNRSLREKMESKQLKESLKIHG